MKAILFGRVLEKKQLGDPDSHNHKGPFLGGVVSWPLASSAPSLIQYDWNQGKSGIRASTK